MIYVPLFLVFSLAFGSPGTSLGQEASPSLQELTVSGVVERLDGNKGMLKTATGKPIFFDIVKPELFRGITVGQRITIQLDEHGRAIKAIESQSIPELPAPTQ